MIDVEESRFEIWEITMNPFGQLEKSFTGLTAPLLEIAKKIALREMRVDRRGGAFAV